MCVCDEENRCLAFFWFRGQNSRFIATVRISEHKTCWNVQKKKPNKERVTPKFLLYSLSRGHSWTLACVISQYKTLPWSFGSIQGFWVERLSPQCLVWPGRSCNPPRARLFRLFLSPRLCVVPQPVPIGSWCCLDDHQLSCGTARAWGCWTIVYS